MATKKDKIVETFRSNLQKSNSEIQASRANRICELARMEFNSLIDETKKQIFKIKDELEGMADISTSNVTTTANRITGTNFDAKEFVEKRANLRYDLTLLEENLKLLNEDKEFYE